MVAKVRIIGLADGTIMATIITAHMRKVRTKSARSHGVIWGIAMAMSAITAISRPRRTM